MKKSLSSIIKAASLKPTIEEKVQSLRENACQELYDLLVATFDPRFTWLLPPGKSPYKEVSGLLDQEGRLYVEIKHMGKFVAVNGQPVMPKLTRIKREMLFLNMLESIDPDDAKMMVLVKDKKSPFKGMTARIAQMAFPQLYIGEPQEEKVPKKTKVKENVENIEQSA